MTSPAQSNSETPAVLHRRARLSASGHSFLIKKEYTTHLILGFRRSWNKICRILVFYAAYIGSVLPTFRDNLPVTTSRVQQSNFEDGPLLGLMTHGNVTDRLPPNYYFTLRKIPKRADFETKNMLITAI
jgi:hypothetical protein